VERYSVDLRFPRVAARVREALARERPDLVHVHHWLHLGAPVLERRVLAGRDPHWRRYFWSRWGYLPAEALARLRGGPVLWIDALSGGEVTQSVTFCRRLREALPDHRLLLSTNNRY
jgi:3-deoxy-D-manno-octulosonic-acid transferase